MDRSIGDMPTLPGGSERSWKGILQPGSSFGRYKVHRFLGRGGMGEVYEVEHELDGAHYAMKVLSSEIPQTPENIRRFEREAQVMARLEHPNVVSVDYFDETDGKYWFRMELAQGIEQGVVTLGDLAARNGGRIGQGLLVCLFEQILEGLSCAHEKGVIHRDLKPGNILLAHSDELTGGIIPKISDFGLVRLVGQDWLLNKTLISTQQSLGERATEGTDDSQGLSTQSLVGTYAYMSPEQKQRRKVDERSDIYAVGLMIYRLLTGYTNPGERIRKKDSSLHAFWQRVVDQSVREDPNDRFTSATAMLTELQRGHKVLASLDGKASLKRSNVEFKAKRCYTANRYLEEASMIFPNDPEVLEFRALMQEQLGILQELKTRMQNFKRLRKYDDALSAAEQFCAICIEDESVNKLIAEYPQLVIREQLRQHTEEASRLLEAEEFEAASQATQKALSLDPEDGRAKQIHDQALATLKKMQMLHTREQVSKGLQKTHSLLRQKRYARALDTLRHTPCSDSTHPTVIALRNACQSGLKKIRQYWEKAEESRKSTDYQGAISLLNKVLDGVAPEDPGTIERLNRLGAEVKELSAASIEMDHAWDNRSYRKCLAAADRILAFQPEHPKAKEYKQACTDKIRIIQPCIDSAEEYHRNQQYDKAIAALQQAEVHYRSGRRAPRKDGGIETQHAAHSPEYREIVDKISAIRRAKASIEQALDRAKERLEARDLLEARLALNDYFELQTDGEEGLLLQQELEGLHRGATMMRRLRWGVVYLAIAAALGLGLASLIVTYRMQKALEESCAALTFASLHLTQEEAGLQLDKLRQTRFVPLFSIDERWKQWKDSLDASMSAYELYAGGAYEEGRSEFENIPRTEFTPFIQCAFNVFVQDMDEKCTNVNSQLVEGDYEKCVADCNAFLTDYPRQSHFLDLLLKAREGRELEISIYDPNIDLEDLSCNLHALEEISPQHKERRKLEEQCIKTVESKYGFLNRLPPNGVNEIERELASCSRALDEEIIPFSECHGYQGLHERLADRKAELERQWSKMADAEDVQDRVAQAKSLIDEQCWIRAKQKLNGLDTVHEDVPRLKNDVDEKIVQLQRLVEMAREQAEQQDWLDAKETMSGLWSIWNTDDTSGLLTEAQELEATINESLQKESEEIRAFVELMHQESHDQIEEFVLDHTGLKSDLMPIYIKWFRRLERDVQDALALHKIDTARRYLSYVPGEENIRIDANDGELRRLLQDMERYKAGADQTSDRALQLVAEAKILQNRQYVEALWYIHQALELNCECEGAEDLRRTLQSKERFVAQKWREAKSFYDDKCYVHAQRTLAPMARDFPGDVRLLALLHDIDAKMKAAEKAAEGVKNRRLRVKDFYDNYPDYEFAPDVDRTVKKEYQDLVDKYRPPTEAPPSKTEDLPDPNWCQIRFSKAPDGVDVTIHIEGHGLKAPGTVLVRSGDRIHVGISRSSEPDCSRMQAISLEPWKEYEIKIRDGCLKRKRVEVQVVRKGWPFKEYDFDAMVDQITKVHPIDEELARKSLEAALKDKENVSKLQVDLIDCWQDPEFMEFRNRPTNDTP